MGRILKITDGKLMISTDVQGNWDDYQQVRARYKEARGRGETDLLVFDGDLVHAPENAPYTDRSLDILDDLIENPDPHVIALLGNHELMHIYHMGQVQRGNQFFVEPMEESIEQRGHHRERYVEFMKSMPYGIGTHSGITVTHTGANPPLAGMGRPSYADLVQKVDGFELMGNLDHDKILEQLKKVTREVMEKQLGHELADDYFDDYTPEVGEVFMQTNIGNYLWDIFFNSNEVEFGEEMYNKMLERFLENMSKKAPQRLVVAGHMGVPEGYKIVCGRQLRISTSDGAAKDSNKVLAVVNAKPNAYSHIPDVAIQQLVGSLKSLY